MDRQAVFASESLIARRYGIELRGGGARVGVTCDCYLCGVPMFDQSESWALYGGLAEDVRAAAEQARFVFTDDGPLCRSCQKEEGQ